MAQIAESVVVITDDIWQRLKLYFEAIDPQGLLIPQEASARAASPGFPSVTPHIWSYSTLLRLAENRWQPWEYKTPSPTLCDWLGECGEAARKLFRAHCRIPQEHVGWKILKTALNE